MNTPVLKRESTGREEKALQFPSVSRSFGRIFPSFLPKLIQFSFTWPKEKSELELKKTFKFKKGFV